MHYRVHATITVVYEEQPIEAANEEEARQKYLRFLTHGDLEVFPGDTRVVAQKSPKQGR